MSNPTALCHDPSTGEIVLRELSDEETNELLSSGWSDTDGETPTGNSQVGQE
jgi:hypothetical protein